MPFLTVEDEQTRILLTPECFGPNLSLAQWFWRRGSLNSSIYFGSFIIISPLKLLKLVQWFSRRCEKRRTKDDQKN